MNTLVAEALQHNHKINSLFSTLKIAKKSKNVDANGDPVKTFLTLGTQCVLCVVGHLYWESPLEGRHFCAATWHRHSSAWKHHVSEGKLTWQPLPQFPSPVRTRGWPPIRMRRAEGTKHFSCHSQGLSTTLPSHPRVPNSLHPPVSIVHKSYTSGRVLGILHNWK